MRILGVGIPKEIVEMLEEVYKEAKDLLESQETK